MHRKKVDDQKMLYRIAYMDVVRRQDANWMENGCNKDVEDVSWIPQGYRQGARCKKDGNWLP